MDSRTALKKNTRLKFSNAEGGEVSYVINKEIGRGGCCIVYDALYSTNAGDRKTVRIKELYPFGLEISRKADNTLVVSEKQQERFEQLKKKMSNDFLRQNSLFSLSGLTNSVSNTIDIYNSHNTCYVVSTYVEGETLRESCNNLSFKDRLSVVLCAARAVNKIHKSGFLYLDLKHENIFVLNEITPVVQLFDFDTLYTISGQKENRELFEKISCTREFAAVELMRGDVRKIGVQTDVFAVGVLLYWLVFQHTPCAAQCEKNAVFDYSQSIITKSDYCDRMFFALDDFFHKSLSSYYKDRYSSMDKTVSQLEVILSCAERINSFVISSPVRRPAAFVGREKELEIVNDWAENDPQPVLFVTGMGGIGKTSVVEEYAAENRHKYDSVVFVNYADSIMQTLCDDRHLKINTISKSPRETQQEYFQRKLSAFHELSATQKILLVIDNFCGEIKDNFQQISRIGWKVVVISRQDIPSQLGRVLKITAIDNREQLYDIFETYSGKVPDRRNISHLDNIITKISGHTLVLELIAKQIAASRLSVTTASQLVDKYGFASISEGEVDYVHDMSLFHSTISRIINALFDADGLEISKRVALTVLSVLGTEGVERADFLSFVPQVDESEMLSLCTHGWVDSRNGFFSLHPVVCEVVYSWDMKKEPACAKGINSLMLQLYSRINPAKQGRYYPQRLLKPQKYHLNFSSVENVEPCSEDRLWIYQRYIRLLSENKYFSRLLYSPEIFSELMYAVIITSQRENEDFALKKGSELIKNNSGFEFSAVLKLLDVVVTALCEQGEFSQAYACLCKIRQQLALKLSFSNLGRYYDVLAAFYDARLGGEYDEAYENSDLRHLQRAIKYAVRFFSHSDNKQDSLCLVRNLLAQTNVLIRSNPEKKTQTDKLLSKIKALISEEGKNDTELNFGLNMTLMWYYTYVEADTLKSETAMEKAEKICEAIYPDKLDKIDFYYVPTANALLEQGSFEKSADRLKSAIKICEDSTQKNDILPFIRKKLELYSYLLDVFFAGGDMLSCKKTAEKLLSENAACKKYGIEKPLPDYILKELEK